MSTRWKQILIVCSIFIAINVIFVGSAFMIRNSFDNENADAASNSTTNDSTSSDSSDVNSPKLQNQYPSNATVGEEYTFFPKITDDDSSANKLTFTVTDGPEWLKFDTGSLNGTPASSDIGSNKVVLKLSDGKNNTEIIMYILVK